MIDSAAAHHHAQSSNSYTGFVACRQEHKDDWNCPTVLQVIKHWSCPGFAMKTPQLLHMIVKPNM